MQNLSLPTTQNAPLKNLTDAANKNNASADKPASAEPNTSFQTMLSKQLQAKQAIDRQASAKQTSARHSNSGHVAAEQKNKPAASNTRPSTAAASDKQVGDNKASTDADSAGNPSTVPNEKAELAPKKLLTAKDDAETKPDTDANASALATSILDPMMLAPVILAPVANATPLLNTQGTSSPAATDADMQLVSTAEIATQKQQNLDAVLSNALSQGKSANAQDKDTQGAGDVRDGNTASEHSRWLDAMLPNAARQTGDESTSARLMLNAIKDSASKDVVMPASFQPAAQINAALSTQQAGSTNAINAYPGKSGWDQAISQKVVWMVGAGEQSATLTLNPPDMGPLQVVIHVHNDQADTTFISDNADVRQALQDGLSNLRDKMSEAGVQLGQANVSSGGQSQQEFQQATQNRLAAQLNSNASASPAEKATNASTLVRFANGLVDTFA